MYHFKHDFNGSVPVFMLDMIMKMKAKVHSILKLVVLTKCTVLVKLEVIMYLYANNRKANIIYNNNKWGMTVLIKLIQSLINF